MPSSATLRIFLALTHAGFATGMLAIFRQARRVPPPELLDAVFCGLIFIAIIAFWWRRRKSELGGRDGLVVGLKAVVAVAAVLTTPLLLMALAKTAASGQVGWQFGIIIIVLGGVLIEMAVAAVVGALAASALLRVVRALGRAGPVAGFAFALAAMALPIGVATVELRAEMGLYDFLTQHDAQHRFPVAVTIEMTVDGSPVTLDRRIACQRLLSRSDLARAPANDPRIDYHWMPNLKSFGQMLGEGSGVFAITPDICRELAPPGQRSGTSVHVEGYIPLVGWTATAATLDSFELYTNGTAFTRPEARVHLDRVAIDRTAPGTSQSVFDGFAHIGWQEGSKGTRYLAVYGIAIEREQWHLDPALAAGFDGLDHPSFVLSDRRLNYRATNTRPPLAWFFSPNLAVKIARNGGGIAAAPISQKALPATIFPLRRDGNEWVGATAERGVMVFYRAPPWAPAGPGETLPSMVTLAGEHVAGDPSRFIYIPGSATLVRLVTAEVALAPSDGPFASR
jgi:hypothetical protein